MADDSMSDEDKALFREHMRSVKPLGGKKANRITSTTPLDNAPPVKAKSVHTSRVENKPVFRKKDYFLSDYINEPVLSESVLSYCNTSLASRRFRDLKNGLIPWEAKLDLHGMKTDAARTALSTFIQNQAQNQKRCLLIIHGKGGFEGAPPVIKNLVNRWLSQFDEVLAFHSARPKDGGHGAVYVMLKRNKG